MRRGILLAVLTLAAAGLVVAMALKVPAPRRGTPSGETPRVLILAGRADDIGVTLTIELGRGPLTTYEVVATMADQRPLGRDAAVELQFTRLDVNVDPATITLSPKGSGRYIAEGRELETPGWWELEAIVRRSGRPAASAMFPLPLGAPRPARSDPAAEQLLDDARAAIADVRSWREVEHLTDGAGSLVITHSELFPPDRLHYVARYELRPSTVGETEVVVIRADRYQRRDSGPWTHETLRQPLVPEGYRVYMRSAEGITNGRQGSCAGEPCRVVLWTQTGGSPALAAWIALRSHRVHRLHMLAPSHYMTLRPFDFGVPLRIAPPAPR